MNERCGIPGCGNVADFGVAELSATVCLYHFELWGDLPDTNDPWNAKNDVDALARLS